MTIDLTEIIVALIGLLATIITTKIIPYIKEKTTSEQYTQVKFWMNVAVKAAEQIFSGSGRGAEKKAYVVEFLNSKGLSVNETEIDALIESTVLDLNEAMASTEQESEQDNT